MVTRVFAKKIYWLIVYSKNFMLIYLRLSDMYHVLSDFPKY
jgi:hypothetical protein